MVPAPTRTTSANDRKTANKALSAGSTSPAAGNSWRMSAGPGQHAGGEADGGGGGVAPVVEGAQPGRLQPRGRGSTGPVRRHARVHALEERDEHGEGDRD